MLAILQRTCLYLPRHKCDCASVCVSALVSVCACAIFDFLLTCKMAGNAESTTKKSVTLPKWRGNIRKTFFGANRLPFRSILIV